MMVGSVRPPPSHLHDSPPSPRSLRELPLSSPRLTPLATRAAPLILRGANEIEQFTPPSQDERGVGG